MSKLIKAVWGGDKPFAIFLTDGTKINIGGNKQGCWLQIGRATQVIQMDARTEREKIQHDIESILAEFEEQPEACLSIIYEYFNGKQEVIY